MSGKNCRCGCSCAQEQPNSPRIDAAIAASAQWLDVAKALDGGDHETAQERAERTRLFEIPGECPPYEAAWIRRDKGAILADIAGFYLAFGFDAAQESGVRHDHLGAISEYLALVRVMEARALEAGNDDAADLALEAYVNCLRDHLADWIAPFCARLRAATISKPMLHAADLVERAWNSTVVHGLPEFSALDANGTPDSGPSTPYECGEASASDGLVELTTSASAPVDDSAASKKE